MKPVRTEESRVEGCKHVYWDRFEDHRGRFDMHYHRGEYEAAGLPTDWVQDNVSVSGNRVLRGLHTQIKNPQGKLVRPLSGWIVDVCLDVRKDSPTFGKSVRSVLGPNKGLYVPPGCLHGFVVISGGDAVVLYKCTTLFDPESQAGVNPLDPALELTWEWPKESLILSNKDANLPSLDEFLSDNG